MVSLCRTYCNCNICNPPVYYPNDYKFEVDENGKEFCFLRYGAYKLWKMRNPPKKTPEEQGKFDQWFSELLKEVEESGKEFRRKRKELFGN